MAASPTSDDLPDSIREALDRLRQSVVHQVHHPTAPDDDLRQAMSEVATVTRAAAVSPDALMRQFERLLDSLLPDEAVRRRLQEGRLRPQLVAMCLRAYFELDMPLASGVAHRVAARLHEARHELARRWLERIGARVALDPNRVFPTDELLDHVPLLIEGIARYVADPRGALAPTAIVIAHARDLGALRHAQGFDSFEILKEFEILGGVLFAFAARVLAGEPTTTDAGEVMTCAHRLHHAVALVHQATATRYLEGLYSLLGAREQRLRACETLFGQPELAPGATLRERLHAIRGAADASDASIESVRAVVQEMTAPLLAALDLLESGGASAPADTRRQRHVRLSAAVAEAVRLMRTRAGELAVAIVVAPDLPDVEVPAAVVELALGAMLAAALAAVRTAGAPSGDLLIRGALDEHVVGPGEGSPRLVVELVTPGLELGWHLRELGVACEALATIGARLLEGDGPRGRVLGFALYGRRLADRRPRAAGTQAETLEA